LEKKKDIDVTTQEIFDKLVDSEVKKIVEHVQKQENLTKLKKTSATLAKSETMVIEYAGETMYFRVSPDCEAYKLYSTDKEKAIHRILNADKNEMQKLFSIQDF
jgi:hypothetical protein